eukprot:1161332-Pelagomonas_calceolata.AAC.9
MEGAPFSGFYRRVFQGCLAEQPSRAGGQRLEELGIRWDSEEGACCQSASWLERLVIAFSNAIVGTRCRKEEGEVSCGFPKGKTAHARERRTEEDAGKEHALTLACQRKKLYSSGVCHPSFKSIFRQLLPAQGKHALALAFGQAKITTCPSYAVRGCSPMPLLYSISYTGRSCPSTMLNEGQLSHNVWSVCCQQA